MNVLVTGSAGFIGRHLTKELELAGACVIGCDMVNGWDLTDRDVFKKIESADMVFHLAARASVPLSWKDPKETARINVQGTENILEYCRINDVTKLVFPSTYVYGIPEYLPVDEKHPINPSNPYAQSKLDGEALCSEYSKEQGISCTILRPFNIFGPGQNMDFLIPTIISQLKKGIVQLADPEPKRDLLYLKDAVRAFMASNLDYLAIGPFLAKGATGTAAVRERYRVKGAARTKPLIAAK